MTAKEILLVQNKKNIIIIICKVFFINYKPTMVYYKLKLGLDKYSSIDALDAKCIRASI